VARNAVRAGIGWVLLNRGVAYIEALRKEAPALAIANVTVDNGEVGRIQGRQLRALLPKGGPVLYLQGPADTSAAHDRLLGVQDAVKGAGIEFRVLNGDWTEGSGEKAVATWLRLKTSDLFVPDAVCGQNDLMAMGARKALEAARPDWAAVPFLGVDGLPNGGQRLVTQGLLASTVVIPSCSGPALELAARFLKGGLPPAQINVTPESFPPLERIQVKHLRRA